MGGQTPGPIAGQKLNDQLTAQMSAARAKRMGARNEQNEELFQTLLSSGQKPYSSPYEPEDFNSPMSNQNPGIGRFG
jgi:hypothetical protein